VVLYREKMERILEESLGKCHSLEMILTQTLHSSKIERKQII
jgi:hypothetical protein